MTLSSSPSGASSNRRRHVRKRIPGLALLQGPGPRVPGPPARGYAVLDISEGGALLLGETPLPSMTRVPVSLQMRGGGTALATASVVRQTQSIDGIRVAVCFEGAQPSAEMRALVQSAESVVEPSAATAKTGVVVLANAERSSVRLRQQIQVLGYRAFAASDLSQAQEVIGHPQLDAWAVLAQADDPSTLKVFEWLSQHAPKTRRILSTTQALNVTDPHTSALLFSADGVIEAPWTWQVMAECLL